MLSTLIILAVAVTGIAVVTSFLFQNSQPKRFTVRDWEQKRRDIDVRIFRYLVDIDEDRYVVQSLPRDKSAAFRRKRTRLALRIVRFTKENADMLIRLAALARAKDNPTLVREADHLIAAATQLRFNLVLARYCLWIRWVFPSWAISMPAVGSQYQALLDSFLRVRRHELQT
jgi:hypothetical protein